MKTITAFKQRPFIGFFLLSTTLLVQPLVSRGYAEVVFQSTERKTALMEVFVSQGCSSCPPAQEWINHLTQDPRLWNEIIPVVYHVDYWDYLGWKDPFATSGFTQRQRAYNRQGSINSVYTPGFVMNGEEWRGWSKICAWCSDRGADSYLQ